MLSLLTGVFPALRRTVWVACDAPLILPIGESPQGASCQALNGAVLALKSQVPGLALTASLN